MILPSSDFPFRNASPLRGYGRGGRRFRGFGDSWDPSAYWAPQPNNYVETVPETTAPDNYVMAPPGQMPTAPEASGVGEFFSSLFTGLSTAFKPPAVRPVQQSAGQPQVAYPYQPGLAPPSAGLPTWALPTAAAVVGGGLLLFVLTRKAPARGAA